jgi:hypothetical protein
LNQPRFDAKSHWEDLIDSDTDVEAQGDGQRAEKLSYVGTRVRWQVACMEMLWRYRADAAFDQYGRTYIKFGLRCRSIWESPASVTIVPCRRIPLLMLCMLQISREQSEFTAPVHDVVGLAVEREVDCDVNIPAGVAPCAARCEGMGGGRVECLSSHPVHELENVRDMKEKLSYIALDFNEMKTVKPDSSMVNSDPLVLPKPVGLVFSESCAAGAWFADVASRRALRCVTSALRSAFLEPKPPFTFGAASSANQQNSARAKPPRSSRPRGGRRNRR